MGMNPAWLTCDSVHTEHESIGDRGRPCTIAPATIQDRTAFFRPRIAAQLLNRREVAPAPVPCNRCFLIHGRNSESAMMMSLDRANQWITLLTNIGVLFGLFVLVCEIRQNTISIKNQTDDAIADIGSSQASLYVMEPDLAAIQTRSATEPWSAFSPTGQVPGIRSRQVRTLQ